VPGPERVVEVEKKPPAPPVLPELGVGPTEPGGTKAIETAGEIPLAPAFTAEQLNAEPSGNWLSSEGGTTGDHFSRLNEITPANAGQLKADWMTELNHSGEAAKYREEADPTVYQGVLYYATGADDIFAVSAASGKILWEHAGELPETVADVCCGWDNRGVALGGGLVYSAVLNGSVEALDQQTGKLVWKTELGEPAEGFTVTSQPLYYEGLVIIGPVGSEYGVRGFMEAFNAKTGALVWKHYNIPAPGEFGHETWPTGTPCKECDNEWEHGGATTWNAPTVDPKDGLIYYSTANAGGGGIGGGKNGGDFGGDTRTGADLWTVAMLALNYKTGELAWGYQQVHHDIWDFDSSSQPTMINVEIGGKKVEGIVQANKDGWAYFVNAETGQPVFPIEEEAVPQNTVLDATYPTQPIPKMPPFNPPKIDAEELKVMRELLETSANTAHVPTPTIVSGGVFAAWGESGEATIKEGRDGGGGGHIGDNPYDPETGDYYVCSHFGPQIESIQSEKTNPTGGETYGTQKGGLATGLPQNDSKGYVTAYNMQTGQIIWADEWPHQCKGGITVTKGGILFAGTEEGEIKAWNAANGAELWHFEIGAGGQGMISVYEYGSKERVLIYAGGNALSKHGDYLWQFSVGGTGPAQKECPVCVAAGLPEKSPWPPAGSTFPYGPVLKAQ
jgi:alcohol dehydrogenase (cytochrome c)